MALANGSVPANALVWRRGWTDWKHANEVEELSAPKPAADGEPPPPPAFIVAAQDAFEGTLPDGPAEPPPPPRYVPVLAKKLDLTPKPPVASPRPPSAKPPPIPAKPATKPSPPLPPAAKTSDPPKVHAKQQPAKPIPTVSGVPSIDPGLRVRTPNVSPAPPPMQPAAAREAIKEPLPPQANSVKRPTLIDPLGAGPPSEIPAPSASPPIVAPAPKPAPPSALHAVTQPPPFEGTVTIADVPKMPPPSVPKVQGPVEELSGSVLLDEPESRPRAVELSSSDLQERESISSVVKAPPLGAVKKTSTLLGLQPTPMPVAKQEPPPPSCAAEETGPEKEEVVPKDAPSGMRVWDMRELRARLLQRPREQLIAGGVLAALVLLGIVGLFIKVVSGSTDETPAPPASLGASTAPPIVASAPPVMSSAPPAPRLSSCSVSGDAHVVSPRAVVGAGIEVASLDGSIALGFASAPKEAMVALLDPATMGATSVKRLKTAENVKRVTPTDKAPSAALDVDVKGDKIRGRRTVGAFDIGGEGGDLVWATDGSDETHKLWSLESDAAVEALRGAPTRDGFAIAYRHAGAIWIGLVKGSHALEAAGAPTKVAGLGAQIGSPALAVSDGTIMVVWADRAAASDPWGLRTLTWHPPDAPRPAQSFKLPEGGLGEHAMSPGVAPLADGKFLLVWTEGPVSSHQVRAQVLSPDGTALGKAFTVSAEGVNAGQGQAAVLPDGRGVIAFLASSGKAFEVRATPIRCN